MTLFLSNVFPLQVTLLPSGGDNANKTNSFAEQLTDNTIYSDILWTLPVLTGDMKYLERNLM